MGDTVIKVPPDGGYGWVIVLANALSNVVIIPLLQTFGLIFKDTFAELGFSATEGSLIINLNSAFGMLVGLINGVLLKVFGYRKIAFVSAFLFSAGVILTSFATTFLEFMIYYGLITSLGMGMSMSAYSLALNTYFKKRRSKAVGYMMTITGFGPILMPLVITLLLRLYTVQGVTLILGAISAHCFIAAMLLQPVKWHMRVEKVAEAGKLEDIEEVAETEEEIEEELKKSRASIDYLGIEERLRLRKDSNLGSLLSIDHDVEAAVMYGMDSAFGGSVLDLQPPSKSRRPSIVSRTWKQSNLSLQTAQKLPDYRDSVYHPELSQPIKRKPFFRRLLHRIAAFFDLDLLKDPIYVNIMLGMSLAIFAEFNFSVLTAFILADFGLNTDQIAAFMSILGVADIIFRFFAPHISEYLNKPARTMYLLTLMMLITTRFSLLISNNYYCLLAVSLGLGMAKGVRTVFMSLVIPMYVPLEKLASASGIQMMVNGLCLLVGGPILGMIRDLTGSYTWCIVIMNMVTFTTVLMWTVEGLILKCRKPDEDNNTGELVEQQNKLLK